MDQRNACLTSLLEFRSIHVNSAVI